MAEWDGRSQGRGVGFAIFIWVIKHLGLQSAYALLYPVAGAYYLFDFQTRRNLTLYYQGRLRLKGWALEKAIYRHIYSFGTSMIDRLAIRGGLQDRYRFTFNGYEDFIHELERDRGLILLTAHFGSWDVGVPFFAPAKGRIHIVRVERERKDVQRVVRQNTAPDNFRTISLDQDPLQVMMTIRKALDKKGIICFMGDRYLPGAHTDSVPFLDAPARFPTGALRIAGTLHCPIYYYFGYRTKRYHYQFDFIPGPTRPPKRPQNQDATTQALRHFIGHLEGYVRRYPDQWYNFFDFWAEAADSEDQPKAK